MIIANLFNHIDYTFFIILLGVGFLALTTGILACFVLVRQQSLLSDTIAHSSLPGICLAFLIVGEKSLLSFFWGSIICAIVAYFCIKLILRFTTLKQDAAMGIVLAVFFGLGISLLSYIQNSPYSGKSGLDSFFFGNITSFMIQDIIIIAVFSLLCILLIMLFWKEFKILVFNKQYAHSLGINVKLFEFLLSIMIVTSIILGIQLVGFILIGAMLIIPAISSRQYSNVWGRVLILSVFFNIFSVFLASWLSFSYSIITGPLIIVVSSVILLFSLLLAPCHGILWGQFRKYKKRKSIKNIIILKNFLRFSESKINPFHPHNIEVFSVWGQVPLKSRLLALKEQGLLIEHDNSQWSISAKGIMYLDKIEGQL